MIIEYLVMGFIIFIVVVVIRTIHINRTNNSPRHRSNTIKHIVRFIVKQMQIVFIFYTTSIGLYIIIERMVKYKIYPASVKEVYSILNVFSHMEANVFVSKIFFLMLGVYAIFYLPYSLLKLYGMIIKENNYIDYLHLGCNKLYKKLKAIHHELINYKK